MEETAVQFEDDTESDVEINKRFLTLVGATSAVMNLVAFSAVGYFALESISYGVIVGVFGGVGSYLFLPWFMGIWSVQEQSDDDLGFVAASRQVSSSAQLGVLGAGLEVGSVVAIAVGFSLAEPDPLLGAAAAVAATLVIYLAGSTLLGF